MGNSIWGPYGAHMDVPRWVPDESLLQNPHRSVKVSTLDRIRLVFKDENLQPLELNSNDLHCVLHFKRDGYSRSI